MTKAQLAKKMAVWNSSLSEIISDIEHACEEMQENFDEKSESWQESEKGQAWSDMIADLESLQDEISVGHDTLQSLMP